MKLKPLNDNILIKRMSGEEKSKGGIIIPDSAKEKPQYGEVLAVGTGKIIKGGKKLPLEVKAGEKVLFSKYSGTDIKVNGEERLIMTEEEILAKID